MPIDIHEFANLSKNPSITDISLKMLQDYYEHYLIPFSYTYILEDNQNIDIKFRKKDFCHLLGIEKIVNKAVHPSTLNNYKGIKGYEKIKDGTIDIKHLKRVGGNQKFKDSKDKMVFFFLLHRMAKSPAENVVINFVKKPGSQIDAEYIVYNVCENAVGHIGLSYDSKENVWFARTFLIERINETNNGMGYIEGKPNIYIEQIIKK